MNWHKKHLDSRSIGDRTADWIAINTFSWPSLWLHTIWWIAWFALQLNVDLLTLVVSLEAILLCILIGMSQARGSERDRHQAEDDYRTNIEAKGEIEKLMEVLARIETKKLDEIMKALKPKKRR